MASPAGSGGIPRFLKFYGVIAFGHYLGMAYIAGSTKLAEARARRRQANLPDTAGDDFCLVRDACLGVRMADSLFFPEAFLAELVAEYVLWRESP